MARSSSSSLLALALAAAAAASASAAPMPLSLSVDSATGDYTVSVGGAVWLSSAPGSGYAIRSDNKTLTTSNGGLTMGSVNPISGNGPYGQYTGYEVPFNNNLFVARFYLYQGLGPKGDNSALVFEQSYPQGLQGTAVAQNNAAAQDLSSAFPAFGPSLSSLNTDLAYAAWAGCMSYGHVAQWTSKGVDTGLFGANGGVVALYNQTLATVVMSSLTDYMVSGPTWSSSLGNIFGLGFFGRVEGIPAGWSHQSIFVSGSGLNDTMVAWGDLLLQAGGKSRDPAPGGDPAAALSYWTDK
jgi:hypothetical protein